MVASAARGRNAGRAVSATKHVGYAAVRKAVSGFGAHVMLPSVRSSRGDARLAAGDFFSHGRPREGWKLAKAAGFRIAKVRVEVAG